MQKAALLSFIIITLLISCRRNTLNDNCESLKDGMVANEVAAVQTAINNFIAGLPDKHYSETNIRALANRISLECNVTVEVLCFDCIQTLPSQSEIKISFNSGGGVMAKCIDLSYNADNKMTYRGMHD